MSQPPELLAILGGLARLVKPKGSRQPASLDDKLVDCGMDSLDTVLLAVYVCEIFGIPEETGKNLHPVTFRDIEQFITTHGTRIPASVEEALAVAGGK